MPDGWLSLRASGFRAPLAAAAFLAGMALVVLAVAARTPIPAVAGLGAMFASVRAHRIRASGRVDVWPDRIDNRAGGRPTSAALGHIERIRVISTLFGSSVQVVDHEGSAFTLAAPRRGPFFRGEQFDLEVERLGSVLSAAGYPAPVREARWSTGVSQVFLLGLLCATTLTSLWLRLV